MTFRALKQPGRTSFFGGRCPFCLFFSPYKASLAIVQRGFTLYIVILFFLFLFFYEILSPLCCSFPGESTLLVIIYYYYYYKYIYIFSAENKPSRKNKHSALFRSFCGDVHVFLFKTTNAF